MVVTKYKSNRANLIKHLNIRKMSLQWRPSADTPVHNSGYRGRVGLLAIVTVRLIPITCNKISLLINSICVGYVLCPVSRGRSGSARLGWTDSEGQLTVHRTGPRAHEGPGRLHCWDNGFAS